MRIVDADLGVLLAFLDREAHQYNWAHPGGEQRRLAFVEKMLKMIEKRYSEIPAANYVHIESITNMGLVGSELILSGTPWCYEIDVFLSLPPNPRNGGISMRTEEHGI